MSKHRDYKLQNSFRGKPCLICKTTDTTVCAHIKSVGSHPHLAAEPFNIWPLCYRCHHELDHELGLTRFVEKYNLSQEMFNRGFNFNFVSRKWYPPESGL